MAPAEGEVIEVSAEVPAADGDAAPSYLQLADGSGFVATSLPAFAAPFFEKVGPLPAAAGASPAAVPAPASARRAVTDALGTKRALAAEEWEHYDSNRFR